MALEWHWKPNRKPAEAVSERLSPVRDSPAAVVLERLSPEAVELTSFSPEAVNHQFSPETVQLNVAWPAAVQHVHLAWPAAVQRSRDTLQMKDLSLSAFAGQSRHENSHSQQGGWWAVDEGATRSP